MAANRHRGSKGAKARKEAVERGAKLRKEAVEHAAKLGKAAVADAEAARAGLTDEPEDGESRD